MSTKNLSYSSEGQLPLFLLISLVIHIGFSWALMHAGAFSNLFSAEPVGKPIRPVVVEVVELPPIPKPKIEESSRARKSIAGFTDRTARTEKGTAAVSGAGRSAKTVVKRAPAKAKKPGKATTENETTLAEPWRWSDPGFGLSPSGIPAGLKEAGGRGSMKPNLLLSEAQIAALTRKYEQDTPAAERGKTLQLNTAELKYRSYLLNMKTRIELYWEYPLLAVKNAWQGNLRITFKINEDGSVDEIKTANSSGYPVLDDSARTALRLAAPFPPFPEDFDITEIKINGRFEYKLTFVPPPN
jgi:protein TonB